MRCGDRAVVTETWDPPCLGVLSQPCLGIESSRAVLESTIFATLAYGSEPTLLMDLSQPCLGALSSPCLGVFATFAYAS